MTDNPLKTLLAAFERASAHWRRSLSLSANEFLVLFHLWMHDQGEMTMGEAGELVNVTSGGLTSLVTRLERADYVARRPHPSDRRRTMLALTEKGKATGDAYLEHLSQFEQEARSLPEPEASAVMRFLGDVAARFDMRPDDPDGSPAAG